MTKEDIIKLVKEKRDEAWVNYEDYQGTDENHYGYLEGRYDTLQVLYIQIGGVD